MAIYHTLKGVSHYSVTVLAGVPLPCIIHDIIHENSIFETTNQMGFEPVSPGPKTAILTMSYTLLTQCFSKHLFVAIQ